MSYIFVNLSSIFPVSFVLPSDLYKANLWLPRAILRLRAGPSPGGPRVVILSSGLSNIHFSEAFDRPHTENIFPRSFLGHGSAP